MIPGRTTVNQFAQIQQGLQTNFCNNPSNNKAEEIILMIRTFAKSGKEEK